VLVIAEQFQANTLAVTRAVEKVLKDLEPSLKAEGVILHPALFRSANFIETAVGHLRVALLAGALLVIAVLFLFLFNVRTALISALAIPLSLLTAVLVLDYFGIGLNTMTLGGLAIALGEVVDDAIIDVENIFRRLRENRMFAQPLPVAQVVLNASVEVRGSVVYATFIVALVFVPALMLSGVTGRLFGPLAIAYIAAILASLVVALTLTPALAYAMLGRHSDEVREPPPVRWLKQRYLKLLAGIERRAAATIVLVALFCALGIALLPFLKVTFLPPLREGHFTLHMKSAPGISLSQTLRLGSGVSTALLQISGVRTVAQRAGRASLVVDPAGVYSSEFEVDLLPLSAREQQRVLEQIRSTLTRFAGANFSDNTFLTERNEETVSGFTAPVVVICSATISIYWIARPRKWPPCWPPCADRERSAGAPGQSAVEYPPAGRSADPLGHCPARCAGSSANRLRRYGGRASLRRQSGVRCHRNPRSGIAPPPIAGCRAAADQSGRQGDPAGRSRRDQPKHRPLSHLA
jgi:Cu/Ag efflux pump CusA